MPGVIIRTPTGWTLIPNLSYAPTPSRDFASFQDYLTGKREYHNPWAEIWDNEELNELIRHRAKTAFYPYRDAWDDFADISRLGHPRSAMATPMYQSMARRLEKSRFLVARLGGGGESGVLCTGTDALGGTCLQNYHYGNAQSINLLTYQFPNSTPVQIASVNDWIGFKVYVGYFSPDCYVTFQKQVWWGGTLTHWLGAYQYKDVEGTVFWQVSNLGGFSRFDLLAGLFPHRNRRFFRYTSTGFLGLPVSSMPGWDNSGVGYVRTELGNTTSFGYISSKQGWILSPSGNLELYNVPIQLQIVPATLATQPTVVIEIFNSSGLIAIDQGEFNKTGYLNYPTVIIQSGSVDEGFQVQSQKYPYVWYSVPTNYSSCECGDFNQKVTRPPSPIRAVRDWTGTNAGPFDPCKHIMKVKQILGIQQNYNDYIPDRGEETKRKKRRKRKKRDFRDW